MPLAPPVTSATRPSKSYWLLIGRFLYGFASWPSIRAATIRSAANRPDLVRTPGGLALDELELHGEDVELGGAARDAGDAAAAGRRRARGGPRAARRQPRCARPSWRRFRTRRSSRSTPRCGRGARRRRSSPRGRSGWRAGARPRRRRSCARRRRSTRSGGSLQPEERSARFVAREARGLRQELSIEPLAELGLVAMNGPNDPAPSLVVEGGRVVELDGRREEEWDALDHFVARYGLDLEVAARGGGARGRGDRAAARRRRRCRATSSCGSRAG